MRAHPCIFNAVFLFVVGLHVLGVSRAAETNGPISFRDIRSLLDAGAGTNRLAQRAQVRGVVTYQHGRYSIFLQDSTAGLYAATDREQPLEVGDDVEVTGRLVRGGFSPVLGNCTFKRLGRGILPTAEKMEITAALQGRYDMKLVEFVGRLAAWSDHGSTLSFTVVTNGTSVTAEMLKSRPGTFFSTLELESTVKLMGICSMRAERNGAIQAIQLLLRSPADVVVIQRPSWWTTHRVRAVAAWVAVAAFAAVAWALILKYQVRKQTSEIACLNEQLEHKVKVRTKELEVVNSELEAFTYSVSHDLKAPVRAIQGFANLIESDYGPALPADAAQFLGRIKFNAVMMSKLISDLLAFSRISQSEIHFEKIDLKGLVEDAIQQLAAEIANRKIEFKIEPLPVVNGDKALLQQAIFNLVSNAVKYTRKREVAQIRFGAHKKGTEIVFEIRDNGVGFSPEYSGKLFQPFQRMHHASEYEGSGVGLAITHRIITRHGGTIWAEAEPGNGASFYFTLPEAGSRISKELS